MNKRLGNLLILVTMALVPAMLAGQGLRPPEQELKQAFLTLDKLNQQIKATRKIAGDRPKANFDTSLFMEGKRFFLQKSFGAAISNLQNFLATNQNPEFDAVIEAHYYLGRAYEENSQFSEAINHYLNYLSSLVTRPRSPAHRTVEVLKQLLPLIAKSSSEQSIRLGEVLAAVTEVEFDDKTANEVLFYAAKNLAQTPKRDFANEWLARMARDASDRGVQTRALFYHGLLAAEDRNFALAKESLKKCLEAERDAQYKDLALITLARVAISQKNPKEALSYYEQIPEKSFVYEEALFETVYLLLNEKAYAKTHEKATTFLSRFPDSENAYRIATIIGYLNLNAGDIARARSNLMEAEKKLQETLFWFAKIYERKKFFSHKDTDAIVRQTQSYISQHPLVSNSLRLYERLTTLEKQLATARADVRNTIYTLGRSDFRTLKPRETGLLTELEKKVMEAFQTAERVLATETLLYKTKIEPKAKVELEAGVKRRQSIFTKVETFKVENIHWKDQVEGFQLGADLHASLLMARQGRAQLAALKFLAGKKSKIDFEELERRNNRIESNVNRALEVLRAYRVINLAQTSRTAAVKLYIKRLATSLFEDNIVLSSYRDQVKTPQEQYLAADFNRFWQAWEFSIQEVYGAVHALDKRAGSELEKLVAQLEIAIIKHRELEDAAFVVAQEVGNSLGRHAGPLFSYYDSGLRNRLARNQKWKADLEWLAYNERASAQEQQDKKYEVMTKILQENLKDLEQGTVTLWRE